VNNFSIVHATLDAPQRWGYVFDRLAAAASFTYQNTGVCFFGHTHVPVAFIRDSQVPRRHLFKIQGRAGGNILSTSEASDSRVMEIQKPPT